MLSRKDGKVSGIGLLCFYLMRNIKTMLLVGVFAAILFAMPILYGMPVEAMVYPLLLCLLVGAVFFLWGFYSFCRRHSTLANIAAGADLWTGQLPPPGGLIEQDYGDIIAALDAIRRAELSHADILRQEQREYFTTWVHQIKTPMAAMDLLLQSAEGEERTQLAAQLLRIDEYVGMVLQYLRSDNMASDLVIAQCSLDDIVKVAVRRYAEEFIRKKIKLSYQPLSVTVLTDGKWLSFVVEQLLSNALKYTRSGSISIYMEPDADKTLVIEDTGIGIAPEDIPRIFENGFTGYNGRLGKKSTGIGLYLCHRIMTGLSHTIQVEPVATGGTRVLLGLNTADLGVE